MAITRIKNGVEIKISSREMKQTIMRANHWNEDQYRKQYDLFKNKLRAYESYRQAHGANVKAQSPQELLYKQARAKIREGSEYAPSLEMQRIQSFSAVSITKGRKMAQQFESAYSKARAKTFAATTSAAFSNFIEQVPKAQEFINGVPLTTASPYGAIQDAEQAARAQGKELTLGEDGNYYIDGSPAWEKEPITDPVELEEQLKDLAEYVHAKQKGNGEVFSGETFGSDEAAETYDW